MVVIILLVCFYFFSFPFLSASCRSTWNNGRNPGCILWRRSRSFVSVYRTWWSTAWCKYKRLAYECHIYVIVSICIAYNNSALLRLDFMSVHKFFFVDCNSCCFVVVIVCSFTCTFRSMKKFTITYGKLNA